jgi:hypothetical protein
MHFPIDDYIPFFVPIKKLVCFEFGDAILEFSYLQCETPIVRRSKNSQYCDNYAYSRDTQPNSPFYVSLGMIHDFTSVLKQQAALRQQGV